MDFFGNLRSTPPQFFPNISSLHFQGHPCPADPWLPAPAPTARSYLQAPHLQAQPYPAPGQSWPRPERNLEPQVTGRRDEEARAALGGLTLLMPARSPGTQLGFPQMHWGPGTWSVVSFSLLGMGRMLYPQSGAGACFVTEQSPAFKATACGQGCLGHACGQPSPVHLSTLWLFVCVCVVVFAIHWHASAMDLHVFPIPIPPPASLPIPSLWVFPVHQPWALVSCIQPGLVICFTLDSK